MTTHWLQHQWKLIWLLIQILEENLTPCVCVPQSHILAASIIVSILLLRPIIPKEMSTYTFHLAYHCFQLSGLLSLSSVFSKEIWRHNRLSAISAKNLGLFLVAMALKMYPYSHSKFCISVSLSAVIKTVTHSQFSLPKYNWYYFITVTWLSFSNFNFAYLAFSNFSFINSGCSHLETVSAIWIWVCCHQVVASFFIHMVS